MTQPSRRFFKSLLLTCALTGCLLPAPLALARQEPRPQEDAVATAAERVSFVLK